MCEFDLVMFSVWSQVSNEKGGCVVKMFRFAYKSEYNNMYAKPRSQHGCPLNQTGPFTFVTFPTSGRYFTQKNRRGEFDIVRFYYSPPEKTNK